MSKTKKEIECLTRLNNLTGQLEDILHFLKSEGLINDNQLKTIGLSADRAKEVQSILKELQTTQKLQMLVYEWTVLPTENICITIISDRFQKEFIFNS